MRNLIFLFCISLITIPCFGNVKLSAILSDGMVLQYGTPTRFWGECTPGEKIKLSFAGNTKYFSGNLKGKWEVWLPAVKAGGPYEITINATNFISIKNILAGEVWVCSGQSNMEFPLIAVDHGAEELKEADYPLIRQFEVEKIVSFQPLEGIKNGKWIAASPATAGRFTAVGFFYARALFRKLKIPIGIINASVGGTVIETWMSRKAISNKLFGNIINEMPVTTVAKLIQAKKNTLFQKIAFEQGGMPCTGDTELWKTFDFDDTKWPALQVPGLWEVQGWEPLNGTVYYRTTVTLTAHQADAENSLSLGKIDDSDSLWVNGHFIGGIKNKPFTDRNYPLQKGILKPGKNSIVVCVEDYGGGGGFISDSSSIFIQCGKEKINISGKWKYHISHVNDNGFQVYPDDFPTLLFNAMIYPLQKYLIKGIIWYQGESNASRASQYASSFKLMIKDWREGWQQPKLPIGFVQLASFNANTDQPGKGSTWAELRAAQALALALPNTGMVVTTDIGNTKDIHPKNKKVVGERLAAWALSEVYHKKNNWQGPQFLNKKIENNYIRIRFKNIGNGLVVKNSNEVIKGFVIASANKDFVDARARFAGNDIIVYNPAITKPAEVRYAWEDDPEKANIFNKEGLPLAPFRTDKRPFLTDGVLYKIGL